jgi:O-acetyl-ADP-ribose deacetylase (regulator of RNase III)
MKWLIELGNNLIIGGVAKAIIKAAGQKNLDKEFKTYLDKNRVLNYEEIFETLSFDLKNYKIIYHIASPHPGLSSYGKILRNTILEIIKKAFNSHRGSIKSIVLPFIGTGE